MGEPEVVVRVASERDVDAIAAFGAAVVPAHDEPIIGKAAAEEQVELWRSRQRLRAALVEVPRPAVRVILEHFAGNERAAALYEREGFVHLRRDPAASGDPAAATVWRVLDLRSA